MAGLTVLALGDNPGLARTDPFPNEVVTKLTSLTVLHLYEANISGVIPPEIANLVDLDLSYSGLTGEIPREITKLVKLQQLGLSGNFLHLPVGFGKLGELRGFDVSRNNLTGNLSELSVPLTQLQVLDLSFNNFSGKVPLEFGEFKELYHLRLASNNLTGGRLPQSLGSMAKFYFIDVSTNSLSGPIPPDMCKQRRLDVSGHDAQQLLWSEELSWFVAF